MISENIKNMKIVSFSLNILLMEQECFKRNPCGELGSFLPLPLRALLCLKVNCYLLCLNLTPR